MVDLDPQTNLTINVIGEEKVEDLFNGEIHTIYDVLRPIETGVSDYDDKIKPHQISENLFLVPGSLDLSAFEDKILASGFSETSNGVERGFRSVSAINRYLDKIAVDYKLDLLFIDTSPNLGVLNKIIILGSDFFVVPVNANIFSVQGVKNIGKVYKDWKDKWQNNQEYAAKNIPKELVLKNNPIFLGWILNNFVVYDKEPASKQKTYLEKLELAIKQNLSEKHTKNGLYQITQKPLGQIQDFSTLLQRTHEIATPVCYVDKKSITSDGSKKTFDNVKKDIEEATQKLIELAEKY